MHNDVKHFTEQAERHGRDHEGLKNALSNTIEDFESLGSVLSRLAHLFLK
jgi:predicted metal-dependent hydrolase